MTRTTTRPTFVLAFILLLASGLAAACGSSSMTSPSGSGATIIGSVATASVSTLSAGRTISSVGGSSSAFGASGLKVTVVGSNAAAMVDGNGQFTLTHVGSGDVVLRFDGPGVAATVTVPAVQDGQTVTIVVSVSGSTAELDSDDRESDNGGQMQLEGRIDALPPIAAAGTFVIGTRIVETNGSTTFVNGGATAAFANLAVGVRVHVSGTADGLKLLATRVDIQNTDATLPVIINGTVAALTGTQASYQFTVDGTVVKGDSTTSFTANSAFTDLANGRRVEVKGLPGNGFVTATSIHVNPN
jgi:hypothetical protein